MSNVIDSRIVEMKFDNKQFESAVSTSMGTIAKLKESLNFEKNGSGFLQGLANTLGKVDLSPIASAAEAAGQKFTAFEAVAVGALMKIGAQAVEVGEKLVKSLSIDQLTEGWSKYEQKTTAVQTIMAATTINKQESGPPNREIITAELIYYWMISYNIPVEFEKWHLNKLLTLINVCSIKNGKPKKMSKKAIMSKNAALNAARRQQFNTKG